MVKRGGGLFIFYFCIQKEWMLQERGQLQEKGQVHAGVKA
jgi:hypothetical protein